LHGKTITIKATIPLFGVHQVQQVNSEEIFPGIFITKARAKLVYYNHGHACALRIQYNTDYLYIKSSEFIGLEIALSEQSINPKDKNTFSFGFGKSIEFKEVR